MCSNFPYKPAQLLRFTISITIEECARSPDFSLGIIPTLKARDELAILSLTFAYDSLGDEKIV